jgi:hypothetical protein
MLVYRLLCAVLMAWAVNWALSRPEAQEMLQTLPEMKTLGPIAGATVGYFNLAVRQGWGFIVAFANGIWAGVLSILLAGIFDITFVTIEGVRTNTVKDFENFMALFGETVRPLLDEVANVPLLVVSLGATALVGAVTEVIHWVLVRVRARRGRQSQTHNTGS